MRNIIYLSEEILMAHHEKRMASDPIRFINDLDWGIQSLIRIYDILERMKVKPNYRDPFNNERDMPFFTELKRIK